MCAPAGGCVSHDSDNCYRTPELLQALAYNCRAAVNCSQLLLSVSHNASPSAKSNRSLLHPCVLRFQLNYLRFLVNAPFCYIVLFPTRRDSTRT